MGEFSSFILTPDASYEGIGQLLEWKPKNGISAVRTSQKRFSILRNNVIL
jgi:hypothetical protein